MVSLKEMEYLKLFRGGVMKESSKLDSITVREFVNSLQYPKKEGKLYLVKDTKEHGRMA